MHIKAIETYLAVTNLKGFHAAARQLNITQTAVSARIKSLENVVGMSLFERGAHGTQLTAFGIHFKPFAEQLVQTWNYASSELPNQFEKRTSLRLGAELSIWDPLLVDLTIWLEANSGEVLFTLNFDHNLNMHDAVLNQLLDIAVTTQKPHGSRLNIEELPAEKLILVSDQRYALGGESSPLFINLGLGHEYDLKVKDVLTQTQQQQIFLGNSLMALRYLLRRGGVGYFPQSMVSDHLESNQLRLVEKAPAIDLACYAITLPESPLAAKIKPVLTGLHLLRQVNTC